MFDRCYNPRNSRFHQYGGRGIRVCERWYKFENFYADVGDPPSPEMSIDRWPNKNGDYEPNNTRWATAQEQADNSSFASKTVIFDAGVRITQTEAAERLKCKMHSLAKRLAKYRKRGVFEVDLADLKERSNIAKRNWKAAAKRRELGLKNST